jgi:hypothetical protein
MAVSGAPEYTPEHAENVADVAMCLLRQVKQIKLPSGISIQIRIGEFLRLGYPLDRPLHLERHQVWHLHISLNSTKSLQIKYVP